MSASQDGRLIVWNALTSQKTHAIRLHCAWVMTCAFSPNGQSVACGGLDSACSIFNLNSQTDREGNLPTSRILTGHKGYVSSCQYVPDQENHLITSSGDQTCGLWDVTTGQRISVFGGEFPSGHTADVQRYSLFFIVFYMELMLMLIRIHNLMFRFRCFPVTFYYLVFFNILWHILLIFLI